MTAPARRSAALLALAAFVALVVVGIVVGGSRPALDQGSAPTVIALCSYLCLLAGALLLLLPLRAAADRLVGGVLLGATAVLVGLDLAIDDGSPNIGGGFVRLLCLGVVVVMTARLIGAVAADRRR